MTARAHAGGPATSASSGLLAVALAAGAAAGGAVALSGGGLALAATLALAASVVATAVEPRVGLLAALAVIPLDAYGRVLERPALVTAYQVLLLATLASWGVRVLLGRERVRLGVAEGAAALVLLAGVWSLPASVAVSATAVACVRLGFEVVLFVLCTQMLSERVWLRRAAAVFVASVLAVSALALLQAAVPEIGIGAAEVQGTAERVLILRATALFADPNILGGLVSIAAAAFLAAAVHARDTVAAALWATACAVAVAAMYLTFSRGSWLAFAASVLVVIATAPPRRRRTGSIAVAALLVALLVIAPGTLLSRVRSSFDIANDTSSATRYYMYVSSLQMIADRPVFGTGLGAYDRVYPSYRRTGALESIRKPHQVPVAFVAETGLAGAVVQIVLLVLLARGLARRRGRPWTAWEAAGAAGTAAIILGSLFEYYLYFEYLWLFAALWVVAARISTAEWEARDA